MQQEIKPLVIAIAGLGLIGGSVAMGLKTYHKPAPYIIALDRDEKTLAAAKQQGIADCILTEPGSELLQADVVFLATPVLTMEKMTASLAPFLKSGAIVTDVGSTKAWLAPRMQALLPPHVHYVGGHPMAGREKSGFFAASADLFRDKWYIITADSTTDQDALLLLKQLAECMGTRTTVMDAVLHDQCAAVISHTPHVGAAALVKLLECYPDPDTSMQLAGGGFRDTTRIASSDADMWADICISNSSALLHSLQSFQTIIADLSAAIEQGDRKTIHSFFSSAKLRRDSLLEKIDKSAK